MAPRPNCLPIEDRSRPHALRASLIPPSDPLAAEQTHLADSRVALAQMRKADRRA